MQRNPTAVPTGQQVLTPPSKITQQNQALDQSQKLLAAIVSLTKALQGTNLVSKDDTASPATVPQAQQMTFQVKVRIINGNSHHKDHSVGNFFYIISNTNANQLTAFNVGFDYGNPQSCPAKFKLKGAFREVTLVNNDAAAATVTYVIGNGDIDYES